MITQSCLSFLDISDAGIDDFVPDWLWNKSIGRIPQFMGTLVNLEALVLRNNNLIGELPLTLKNCTRLVILDVSENLLSGPITSWTGESLQQLEILSLRVNHFFGSVPVLLCNLRQIHLLELSRNHLSGEIRSCLRNFTAMMESGGEIARNLGLCGEQHNKSCPRDETTAKPQGAASHGEDDNLVFCEALYLSLGLGFFTGFWGLLGPILLWQPWRNAYQSLLNCLTDYIFVMVEVNLGWLKD
ncbi:Receptor-like protein EIX2 [Glycine soja]